VSQFGASSTAEEVSSGVDLSGKLALVTGATSGLGLETLRVLALRGAHVIATGRTRDRAAEACAAVAPGRSTPVGMDLEQWDSVVAAAAEVRALGRPLDVLICNAGIMAPPELRLVHGVEQQFAVNHLGHFILCQRLLPAVQAASQGRVVVVSSALYANAPPSGIDFDNLDGSQGYDPQQMYGQSKLANALFAFELARRMTGTRVTANALHPGVANTNLDRSNPAWRRLGARLVAWNRPWVKSVEAAAATQVYVATAPSLATVSGHFFEDCNPIVPAGPHIQDAQLAAALWATSEELTTRYRS
jgi:NAD(P)-dependent dehydrogenase (short-subunit alcohol dehydrogenase family)